MAYAKGSGTIRGKDGEKVHATPALHKSESFCSDSLFHVVKKIRIDSTCLVSDLVERSDMVREQLWGMVKGAQVAKREYLSDGTVEATLAFSMLGGFAQLALPENIKQVPQIKTIPHESSEEESAKSNPPIDGSHYTGLILDARGLKGQPAMAPMIVSESGEEIYGPAIVSREYAVQQGMAAFETDMMSAQRNSRVMNNPMVVRGLKAQGSTPCDFVISDADGRRVRSASENLLFLKQCRVVFVLD
jgi:hypothetical protein